MSCMPQADLRQMYALAIHGCIQCDAYGPACHVGGATLAYILTKAINTVCLHAIADAIDFVVDEGKQSSYKQQQQTTRVAVHSSFAQSVCTIERHHVEVVSTAVSSKGC